MTTGRAYANGYSYRRTVTVPAGTVGSDLTDFPILVTASLDASKVTSSGYDIRFETTGGTQLDHQIDSYSSGALAAWVRIPTLTAASDTVVYVYYGNSSIATGSEANPSGVWASPFVAVWHMAEDPSGSAPQILDSTSGANHLTSYGSMTSGESVTGQVGKALSFDGSNDYLALGAALAVSSGQASTFAAWVKLPAGSGNANRYVTGMPQRRMAQIDSSGHLGFYSGSAYVYGSVALNDGAWHHIEVVDRTSPSVSRATFIDGIQDMAWTNLTGAYAPAVAYFQYLGDYNAQAGTDIGGVLDEVRLSSLDRSSAWVAAEYAGQSAPATFAVVGSESSPSPASASPGDSAGFLLIG